VDHWYVHVFTKPAVYLALKYRASPEEFASLTDEQIQKSCWMITRVAPSPTTVKLAGMNRVFFEYEATFPKYKKGLVDFNFIEPGKFNSNEIKTKRKDER